jgi:hypothetical protein
MNNVQLTINRVIVLSIATTFKSLVGRLTQVLGFSPNLMFLNVLMVHCSIIEYNEY